MNIGLIGLGRMGLNLALNMKCNKYDVIGYDLSKEMMQTAFEEKIETGASVKEIVSSLKGRRILWIMVPEGKPVDDVIEQALPHLAANDIIVDGGNSHYKDSIRRYKTLKEKNIDFLDCGTSGGLSGALNGACTTIGGEKKVFEYCEDIFKNISVKNGYLYTGESGTGHFVKMVHNGIEYAMMQSIGEGFDLLQHSGFSLDKEKIAGVWSHGSVIRGWLMELTENAFSKDKNLDKIRGIVHSTGGGKWTVETGKELGVSLPAIEQALQMRYQSHEKEAYSAKIVAALRNEFGGHPVEKAEL